MKQQIVMQHRRDSCPSQLDIEPLERRLLLTGDSSTSNQIEVRDALTASANQIPTITAVSAGNSEITIESNYVIPFPLTNFWIAQFSLDDGYTWQSDAHHYGKTKIERLYNGFTYKCRLIDAQDSSRTSNTVVATPRDNGSSSILIPRNLQATPGDEQWTISWDVPAGMTQSIVGAHIQITEYRQSLGRFHTDVYGPILIKSSFWGEELNSGYTISNDFFNPTQGFPENAGAQPSNPILNGVEYIFNVRLLTEYTHGSPIFSQAGGQFSEGILVTPGLNSSTVPTAPQSFTKTITAENVTLSWNPPISAGTSPLTRYRIGYRNKSPLPSLIYPCTFQDISASSNSCTFLSHAASDYDYFIIASNATGWSGASIALENDALEQNPPGDTSPSAPRNLQAIAGDGNVTLSWDPPLSNGGSAVTEYQIAYSANGGSDWSYLYGTTTTETLTLTNNVTYQFAVSAKNSVGWSDYSSTVTATPYDTPNTSPSAPRNFQVVTGDREVTLSWNAPLSNGGQPITGYRIELSGDGGATWTTHTTSGTSKNITGITNGITYLARVAAINSIGVGSYSNQETVLTQAPATKPSAPRNFQVVTGNREATFSWDVPLSNGGQPITGYRIELSEDEGATWTAHNTSGTSKNITGITNGIAYLARVAATNSLGVGSYSNQITVNTQVPATIPSVPRNFQALARDDGVTLSWDAPVSNGGATITGYQITYRANSDTNWTTLFSTSASIALSDFTNGNSYHFTVRARNNIGTSDYLYEIVTLQTIPSITWHEQLGNTWLGDDPNQNLIVEFSSSTSRRNITKDTQGIGSLFQDKWEIFEAETILNKNILFARHLVSGCVHRFVANSDWAILGMSHIGNSGSEQLPRSARGSHYPVDTQTPQIPLDTQVPIEAGGNFTLRKSYSGSLFIDNLPLTSSDEPVRYNMHSGYRPAAADEIDDIKKILFVNSTGSSIVWDFESDGSNGVISAEITESDVEETRALENAFTVDINRDGFIGLPN